MGREFKRKWNWKLLYYYIFNYIYGLYYEGSALAEPRRNRQRYPQVPAGVQLEHRVVHETFCTHFCACTCTNFVVLDGHRRNFMQGAGVVCIAVFVTGTVYRVSVTGWLREMLRFLSEDGIVTRPGVQKFSRSLRATSKFEMPGDMKLFSMLRKYK